MQVPNNWFFYIFKKIFILSQLWCRPYWLFTTPDQWCCKKGRNQTKERKVDYLESYENENRLLYRPDIAAIFLKFTFHKIRICYKLEYIVCKSTMFAIFKWGHHSNYLGVCLAQMYSSMVNKENEKKTNV